MGRKSEMKNEGMEPIVQEIIQLDHIQNLCLE